MSFIEEAKRELFLGYAQLIIFLIIDIGCVAVYYFVLKEFKTAMWIPISIFGFFTFISIVRIILLHLSIYYWRRSEKGKKGTI